MKDNELIDCGKIQEVAKPFILESQGVPHLVYPDNFQTKSLADTLPRPTRMQRTVNVIDVESLRRYVDVHKTERTALYISSDWPKNSYLCRAIMDDGDGKTLSWRDEFANLAPALSDGFTNWMDIDGRDLSQLETCRFLDRNLRMIVVPNGEKSPTASEVMSFASNLSDVKKVEFKKSINLDNGRVQLTYNEDEGGAGAIQIPREFYIEVQPIKGHPSIYQLRVSMRYRIVDNTRLVFTLELRDIDVLLDQIRGEIITDIRSKFPEFPIYITA